MIETWSAHRELHIEIKDYKEKANLNNPDKSTQFDLEFHDGYIQFLDEATKSILRLREKTIEKHNKL
jgi:hypothetical protein